MTINAPEEPLKFRGPWAGLPVAWTEDDRFDELTYRADVRRCCAAGAPGVYTGGTTGEWYAMDFDEFRAVARATVEECHAVNRPAMIGCTSTYSAGASRRAAYAKEIGADAVQVAFPCWLEIGDREVIPFIREVGQAAGELPLSIYDTKRSKKSLTVDQHLAIKEAVPQYAMVKATGGTIGATPHGCARLAKDLSVFVAEPRWAELGPVGAAGWCSSAIYWGPRFTLDTWDAVERKDWVAVRKGCEQFERFYAFLFDTFAERGLPDGAYDRIGARATGFLSTSLHNRKPYPSATADDVTLIRRYFESHFPEMLQPASAINVG